MRLYPVFLDLSGTTCLVAGTGPVGRRKLRGLLHAGLAEIRVVSLSEPDAELRDLLEHKSVRFMQRAFQPEDVAGCRMVCAATDAPAVNAAIAAVCREQGILCTVADAPETGSCIIPARIERGPLQIGLSTGGLSPALAQRIKNELADWLADRYDAQLVLLARLRPLLLGQADPELTQALRAEIFHRAADADMGTALRAQDRAACADMLHHILPPALHRHIAELLHELV